MILFLLPVLLGVGAAMAISNDVFETMLVLLIKALAWLTSLIFYPINALITSFMPQFDSLAASIQPIFDAISSPIAWVLNSVFISASALSLIIAYYTFKYSVSITIWSAKLLLKWKNALL